MPPYGARRLLAPSRWRHGDTLLMCLSTSQIGYSWIMAPDTLPPAYINFLNRHGDASLTHLAAVRVSGLWSHCTELAARCPTASSHHLHPHQPPVERCAAMQCT